MNIYNYRFGFHQMGFLHSILHLKKLYLEEQEKEMKGLTGNKNIKRARKI